MIYSPFPTLEAARAAAQVLLAERLVACCNLLPGVESHYRWEGVLTQSAEVVLIAKTTADRAAAARARLASLHPYTCPAILALETETNAPFLAWVASETAD